MKRRRAEESADGLALMTSSVMSSYSADGLREQSQESAGSLYIQTQERSDVVEEEIQSQATVHQQMIFGVSVAKQCRSNKLIRQRFAFALRFSRWYCDDKTSRSSHSCWLWDWVCTQVVRSNLLVDPSEVEEGEM
ncbi:hypothetical protein F511_30476 [Dorcoceras hygrometricum]|uniref:Uncharacterized protein n=1 Tax=Dorcoceras hygrometricum TaxID=472368 RepID=A0A2Z7BW78_9LAMI|nr:hypothetical protein F511_30476 [Dorcoceras hygrometricum]